MELIFFGLFFLVPGVLSILYLLFGLIVRLIIPSINAQLATIRHAIFKFAAVNGPTIGGKLSTEVGIEILTAVIEGSDVAVATAPLAVGLGVVSVEVVAAREGAVAARNPTDMRLLLGVALHVALEMFLALETPLAARLLALELHLLND